MTEPLTPHFRELSDGTPIWEFGCLIAYQYYYSAVIFHDSTIYFTAFETRDEFNTCIDAIAGGHSVSEAIDPQAKQASFADIRSVELLEWKRTLELHGSDGQLFEISDVPSDDDFAQLASVFAGLKSHLNATESVKPASVAQAWQAANQLWVIISFAGCGVGGWLALAAPGDGFLKTFLMINGWLLMGGSVFLLIYLIFRTATDRPRKAVLTVTDT